MNFLITASVLIVACGGQVLAKPPKGSIFNTHNEDESFQFLKYPYYSLGVCKTAEAPAGVGKWEGSPNTECTFPFTDEGKEYRGCTSNDNAGMYWCETVDGNWGNCRDDCPLHYDVPGTQTFKKACFTEADYIEHDLISSERAHFEPNVEESLF